MVNWKIIAERYISFFISRILCLVLTCINRVWMHQNFLSVYAKLFDMKLTLLQVYVYDLNVNKYEPLCEQSGEFNNSCLSGIGQWLSSVIFMLVFHCVANRCQPEQSYVNELVMSPLICSMIGCKLWEPNLKISLTCHGTVSNNVELSLSDYSRSVADSVFRCSFTCFLWNIKCMVFYSAVLCLTSNLPYNFIFVNSC